MTATRYQISALVVTFNESKRLHQCLTSLDFCEDVLVVDLGSTDNSVEIAESFSNVSVILHEKVSYVEMVWGNVACRVKYNWILRLDPDEVFHTQLTKDVVELICLDSNLGTISLPHQYYFCGKRLDTTIWGGVKYIERVFHRERVNIQPYVHRGLTLKDGYEHYTIPATPDNCISHFWVDSLHQMYEKHNRYIKGEGEAKFKVGKSFSWNNLLFETIIALKVNLVNYRGLRGGYIGIFLSFFYTWYVFMSYLSLRRYQKEVNRNG